MTSSDDQDISGILHRFREGESGARAKLFDPAYGELKQIATRYMRRKKQDHTLQTTALVNEAYLKLVRMPQSDWKDRAHFFGVAAQVMRHILVDHARRCVAGKRGGGHEVLPLEEGLVFSDDRSPALLQLDEALDKLAARDPRACQVVELRVFGGLSFEEAAEVTGLSPRAVKREWQFARSWLRAEISGLIE